MPEMFGTHHSKMMILIRHDDQAQVVIHTANMIAGDWQNMCQAVWRSPLLPLVEQSRSHGKQSDAHPIGSGERFKADLLHYLGAYGGRLKTLRDQLKLYDFSSVRAALVASTPSKVPVSTSGPDRTTSWGWPGLKEVLQAIPVSTKAAVLPHINVQVSSIATLTDKWVDHFFEILSTTSPGLSDNSLSVPSFFKAKKPEDRKPNIRVIFPTPDEVRRSLDGYESGGSIHMKLQSATQIKQHTYMKPMMCKWAGDGEGHRLGDNASAPVREAGRRRAAPHIKTFLRFSDKACTKLDWAMVTSANLSTQAWGALPNRDEQVRICSYEIGVVVWPELFAEEGRETMMVPVFKKDMPEDNAEGHANGTKLGWGKECAPDSSTNYVGFRMPYDLPLVPYAKDDVPWCATGTYTDPDWKGVVWGGYEPEA